MIGLVDVWSCAIGALGQSVGLGYGCSSPAHRHRIPSPRPPCPHRPSHRSNSTSFSSFFAPNTRCFHSAHQIAVLLFQFAWTCFSTLTPPAVNKLGCTRLARLRLMAPSRTNQARARSLPFRAPIFSSFFLFVVYASSFPMNRSFLAWTIWDADTGGLHVLLRTNPVRVLTDMTCCP